MDSLLSLLGDLGYLVQGTLVVLAVAVALTALNKILSAHSKNVSGKKFRNQLVMIGATFAGVLTVIIGLPLETAIKSQLLTLTGILISATIALSSSTLLGNAMAGIMLKAVGNFRSGDFIRMGEFFGRVTERGLFHTEIQTPDRDLTTLPNLLLATSSVTVIRQSGTIVSASVSLGYDVPHTKIEALLVQAAEGVGLTEPFVQIVDLGDFSVTYRTAGLLTETKQLIAFGSRLRGAILDTLHSAGVEIVSPDFTNARVFTPDSAFIPAPVIRAPEVIKDAAPVDVVFDKAEDAESLSRLQHKLAEREKEIAEAKKNLKSAGSPEEKTALEGRIVFLEKMKDALHTAIVAAEERESRHDD